MLTIHNVEGLDNTKLNVVRKKSKKSQILLYETQRRMDDFVNKIKYRMNGKYSDVPHFIVSKLGYVYQLFDTNHSSITFDNPKLDKKMIKIAVENLGWLNKNAITGIHSNWIGDPYRSEPLIKNWRDYYFWDKHTESQITIINELCEYLCDLHNITKQSVPSNGYLEKVSNFKGIISKSNFSNIYTDMNPSFNFKVLFKNVKHDENRL